MGSVERIGVYGASGSGKTSLVRSMLAKRRRVVFFDPQADAKYWREFRTVGTVRALGRALRDNPRDFRICYVPNNGHEANELNEICDTLRIMQSNYSPERRKGKHNVPVTLAVDELNITFPTNSGPRMCPNFAGLCSRGRHYGIELIGISQRISEVHTRFRGNTETRYILRQADATDVRTAGRQLGMLRGGGAIVERLAKYRYLTVTHEGLERDSRGSPKIRATKKMA